MTEDRDNLPELPTGWVWVSWEQIGFCQNGRAFPSKEYQPSGVKLLRPGNLHKSGNVLWTEENTRYLPEQYAKEFPSYIVGSEELIINLTAQSLQDEFLGRICLTEQSEYCLLNQRIARLTPIQIPPKYLLWLFKSRLFRKFVDSLNTGSLIQHMFTSQIEKFNLPLPPLNEQRRIVAKIEALKARSQRVKEELEAIPALLDQFRQSVLAAAFRGDLTADWRKKNPDVEPASVLLECIRSERRRRWEEAELEKMKAQGKTPKDDKWKEKYREPELSNQSHLPDIPKEWLWTTMDEIADIDLGKMLDRGKEHKGKLFPYLRNINIRWGYIDLTDLLEMDFSQHEIERFSLKKNDVLVCEGGEPGRSAIWENSDSDIKYQKTLHRVRPFLEIPPLWFVYHLKLDTSIGILENYFSGSTIKHFTKISFQKYAVRLASVEEQKEIIRRIQSLFKAANEIQQQYEEAKAYLNQLDQSILAKAFRGELVPQDPSDEPASVLLERIRAEREKLDTKKKAKGKSEKKSRKAKSEAAEPEQLSLPGFE